MSPYRILSFKISKKSYKSKKSEKSWHGRILTFISILRIRIENIVRNLAEGLRPLAVQVLPGSTVNRQTYSAMLPAWKPA